MLLGVLKKNLFKIMICGLLQKVLIIYVPVPLWWSLLAEMFHVIIYI